VCVCVHTARVHFQDKKLEEIITDLECKSDKAECDAIVKLPTSQEVLQISRLGHIPLNAIVHSDKAKISLLY